MVFRPLPNCQHLDNYRRCKVHKATWWGGRPACIIDRPYPPADGVWTCPDQKPWPRPAPPTGGSLADNIKNPTRMSLNNVTLVHPDGRFVRAGELIVGRIYGIDTDTGVITMSKNRKQRRKGKRP